MFLNFAEACRSTIDCDFVVLLILIKLIFYAVVDQVEDVYKRQKYICISIDEDGNVQDAQFIGGCDGNTKEMCIRDRL